jgi:hypothetical protein
MIYLCLFLLLLAFAIGRRCLVVVVVALFGFLLGIVTSWWDKNNVVDN